MEEIDRQSTFEERGFEGYFEYEKYNGAPEQICGCR
jgi:hypothetical protein